MMRASLVVFALVALQFAEIHGHGMLMDPVNRGSAWRVGFKTPINYDDDGNYCGGFSVHVANGGKCGTCGDNYKNPQPRANENGGLYGTGTIVKTYKSGELIDLNVRITANHWGFFRFAICPLKHGKELETEECFDKYPLTLEDGNVRYTLKSHNTGDYPMKAYLPRGLTCEHCVLRWDYTAGNNWGTCPDGTGAVGCGPQETFRSCSDIKIV